MTKQIKFTFEGVDYVLEFNRRSIEWLENQGFVANDIANKPMTTLPALFAGAFLANHRGTPKSTIDRIFKAMPNKEDLIGKLAEMYSEPISALFEEPVEDEGNVEWETSW